MSLSVLPVDDQFGRIGLTQPALEAADCHVHISLSALQRSAQVTSIEPDAANISTDSPDQDTPEHICGTSSNCPHPVVMFADGAAPQTIRAAIQTGVGSYVVAGLDPPRLRPILDVALSRFPAFHAMRDQLTQGRHEPGEKKRVEQANRRLIRPLGVSEEEPTNACASRPWIAAPICRMPRPRSWA
jgi:response regulator NasT